MLVLLVPGVGMGGGTDGGGDLVTRFLPIMGAGTAWFFMTLLFGVSRGR